MRKCCLVIIGLILSILVFSEHYDLYIPEVWELPMPHTLGKPSYTFIESGIASDNSSVFYSDIIRGDFCINSFIHNQSGRTVSQIIVRSSKAITDNWLTGIKTHSLYRNQEGTRYSSIPLYPFTHFRVSKTHITYNPIVLLYSDNMLHGEPVHRFSLAFKPNEYSVGLYSAYIGEHAGITVGYNDLHCGVEFNGNMLYPALSFSGGNGQYTFNMSSGFRHIRPIDYAGIFSHAMDSAQYFRHQFVYGFNTNIQINAFSFNTSMYIDSEPESYRDIHYRDMQYKVSAGYFKRIDRTLFEASVNTMKTRGDNYNYLDMHIRHDRKHVGSGIVHEVQYVHESITNILSAYIILHAPISLKTGVRNIFSQDDNVNYYYNSERTFFINFEYSSGQFIR